MSESPYQGSARFSECGTFRYHLTREWDDSKPPLVFIMLNPSIADESQDDPTIRKCIGFAKVHEYGSIEVFNLFAYRATDPRNLRNAGWPVGPLNDAIMLTRLALLSSRWGGRLPVVCAWGAHARAQSSRVHVVLSKLQSTMVRTLALRVLEDGTPAHPLMLPYSCPLLPYTGL